MTAIDQYTWKKFDIIFYWIFMNVYGMVTVITFMPTTNLLPERSASLHTPCFPFWQLYVLEYLQGNPDEKILYYISLKCKCIFHEYKQNKISCSSTLWKFFSNKSENSHIFFFITIHCIILPLMRNYKFWQKEVKFC